MPKSVRQSFDEQQLIHIRKAIGDRSEGEHSLDWRAVFTLPLCGWHFYFVFLLGKNRRELTDKEKQISILLGVLLISVVTLLGLLFIAVAMYLLKSAAGIDLFPDFSLGLWHWFKVNRM
ncbi:3-phosphoshikimate 1-carboxyvinyltransferase [Psychromonas sp. MME2]|uniref:3-phosphoshikimate 1-carboxyvinyltransferase n=2 Tax=unclassified Psychromonas TaxID=2614957 RepID=UPI00339D1FC4